MLDSAEKILLILGRLKLSKHKKKRSHGEVVDICRERARDMLWSATPSSRRGERATEA